MSSAVCVTCSFLGRQLTRPHSASGRKALWLSPTSSLLLCTCLLYVVCTSPAPGSQPPVRANSLLLIFGRRAFRLMRRELLTVGKQLASPPRITAALRPPHPHIISLHANLYIHSGPHLAEPFSLLLDPPSEVIEASVSQFHSIYTRHHACDI